MANQMLYIVGIYAIGNFCTCAATPIINVLQQIILHHNKGSQSEWSNHKQLGTCSNQTKKCPASDIVQYLVM